MLKKVSDGFTQNEAELMATYEELYGVAPDKKVTQWWGDMNLYEFKLDIKAEQIKETLDNALKAIKMSK